MHFVMKLFFAAPLSGLPSDPTALGAQASRLHLARKAVRAAPASSRPSFPTALLSHVPGACAAAEPMANAVNKTASISRVIFILLVYAPPLARLRGPSARSFLAISHPQRFLLGAVPSGSTAGPVPSSAPALGHEGILGAGLEHDVGAPPRLIVDQTPFMALSDMVHGDQHIARSEYERLPVRGGELERSRQRDHELRLRVGVPIVGGMRRRFLEMDGNHVGAIAFIDRAFEHMRCVVGSRVELERAQHFSAS